MARLRQLPGVRRTATAASRSVLALPHSLRAAGVTDERLVYGRSTILARVLAPAASRRLLNAFTAERACLLVVTHGFGDQDECNRGFRQRIVVP